MKNLRKDIYARARRTMVDDQIIARGVSDVRVLDAMLKVPRHFFVAESLEPQAYSDFPLSIGDGQTISQPFMVAFMTEALKLKGGERVLEIGTGSGYQAAILACIVEKVYSVERISRLADRTRKLLDSLNYYNILIKVGDGTQGWSDEAPFDAIVVTAGAPFVPPLLFGQLKDGGRLVVPVGDDYIQDLMRYTKRGGEIIAENLGGCRFVKLIGKDGFED